MPSFKLNLARIRGCPAPDRLAAMMTEFGMPEAEDYGVIAASAASSAAHATLVRHTFVTVRRVDSQTGELSQQHVAKDMVIPFSIMPGRERLEVYAGGSTEFEHIGVFLNGCLALATVVHTINLDLAEAIDRLAKTAKQFQLRAVKVSDYSANSYMTGQYAPGFLDTQHGMEFLEQYGEALMVARVKFWGPSSRVTATLRPDACLSYSCCDDDQVHVQATLKKLIDA
jgi:hypothetical protein